MAGILWSGFSKTKLKANLSMGVERLKLQLNKSTNVLKAERREVANMLREKQFDKARIRVESVIRKQREHEAQEIIQLMCEVLLSRIDLIASEKTCSADMEESVRTIIWATPRLQHVDELKEVREQLRYKYGDDFFAGAMKGTGVNDKVLPRLSATIPDDAIKTEWLTNIAGEYKVAFNPATDLSHSAIGLPTVGTPISPGPPPPMPEPVFPPRGGDGGSGPGEVIPTAMPAGVMFFDPMSGHQMLPFPGYGGGGGGGYPPPFPTAVPVPMSPVYNPGISGPAPGWGPGVSVPAPTAVPTAFPGGMAPPPVVTSPGYSYGPSPTGSGGAAPSPVHAGDDAAPDGVRKPSPAPATGADARAMAQAAASAYGINIAPDADVTMYLPPGGMVTPSGGPGVLNPEMDTVTPTPHTLVSGAPAAAILPGSGVSAMEAMASPPSYEALMAGFNALSMRANAVGTAVGAPTPGGAIGLAAGGEDPIGAKSGSSAML